MRSTLRRWSASLSIADAAVSSLGNFGLVWVGAQLLDLKAFGQLSVIMTIGFALQGTTKSAFVDAFTLRYSAESADRQARRSPAVLATSLSAGALIAAVIGLGSLVISPENGSWLALAAVTMPLIAQDTLRWICYARHRRLVALSCTTMWTVLTGLGVVILWITNMFNTSSAILVWGTAAGAAALATMVWLRLPARPTDIGVWLRESKGIGARSAVDYGLTQAVGLGGGLLVAAIAGVVEFGLFRVAQLPLAVIQIAIMGSIAVLQPAMVRRVADGRSDRALDLARKAALSLSAFSITVGAIATVMPGPLAAALFGEAWPAARSIVPVLTIGMAASGVAATYGPYLRATDRLGLEVRLKLLITPVAALTIAFGSSVAGGLGGATGQSIATGVVAACFVCATHNVRTQRVRGRE